MTDSIRTAPREVHLTPNAEAELSSTVEYIAARNPMAAGAMAARFDEFFHSIASAPGAGSRSRIDSAVRWRALGNYLVYYEFDEANDRIVVIAVIHGARMHHRMRRHRNE